MIENNHNYNYASRLIEIIKNINFAEIDNFIEILNHARINKKNIFFIGNGGNAATASHFANDFSSLAIDPKFRAISLTDNIAYISAIANDFGYEHIFTRQLEGRLKPGDVVVGISASGNSKNVINAIECANRAGAETVGLLGFDGGAIKNIARHTIHIETDIGEYGPVEDVHLVIDHMVVSHFMPKEPVNKEQTV